MPKYKQQPDGRYMTRVWDGTYLNGKKHYIPIQSRKSSRDLEQKVIAFQTSISIGGPVVNSSSTFYQYANDWLSRTKVNTEKSTQSAYRQVIKKYFKDIDCPLSQINAREIQDVINNHQDIPRTCKMMQILIKQILKSAEIEHLIPRGRTDDIMSMLSWPKHSPKAKRPLSDAEKDALVKADFSPIEAALVWLLYYTGIRREEALVLAPCDINNNVLSVSKAVGYVGNKPYIKSTKSSRGTRKIPIPKALCEILKEYTADIPENDLIFPGKDGPMTAGEFYSLWRRIRKKIYAFTGDTKLTPHIFRHNYCTMLCYQSAMEHTISTKKIAELLGDREEMVIRVYSHIIDDLERPEESIESALKLN